MGGLARFSPRAGNQSPETGVPIKVAQLLLRQADFGTAANYYVKAVDEDAKDAMRRLELVCNERGMEAFEASGATIVN